MEREKLGSRMGFIFLSAGCAIGIGNVWRFPYITGLYGGGVFVLFYLFFLITMGIPVMTMEFAVGRASRKSIIKSFAELEKPGQKWHLHGYLGMAGNYLLMMFYTTVAGWMLYYFYLMLTGKFVGKDLEQVSGMFQEMLGSPGVLTTVMAIIVVAGILICSMGLQNGVERITKVMMSLLLIIIVVLAVHSMMLEGGMEGLKFYLSPDWQRMKEVGVWETVTAAMNQAFFTLSLGIGAMAIFGSYIDKKHTLLGESVNIAVLDTFVAIVSGLIIFPSCFAFGISPDMGPSLIFITLPNVFNGMAGGRIWGTLFFIFMTFAAFSTILAVFENIISCGMDLFHWSRKKSCIINLAVIFILSLPCVLGYNLWSAIQPLGEGSTILDLEDFVVSNVILPIGSLCYLLFCVSRMGWGFDKYRKEANTGDGLKVPGWIRIYATYILPVLLLILIILGWIG
ncbi:sodium-dependent transporter [Parablautia intestinalis]|uniref:sodium-dependent transporter n=1 Tax=Parablautia intestinalis TaxID=2320100 RepID=UPI00259CA0F8|nr:sodium-dependent transporter [Parablautia intestinalis]MCI8616380.1 sodium-dependent transporter [Lachnospiraceae bacterium]